MQTFEHNIDALERTGRIIEGQNIYATPAFRVDLACVAPLSARPATLDAFLAQALTIFGDTLTFYGAEGEQLAASRGRKPRATDIAQLTKFSALMRHAEADDAKDVQATIQSLREQGVETIGDARRPSVDSGNIVLSDTYPIQESGNHIVLRGHGGWGMSLSFSLKTVRAHAEDVLSLAHNLLISGIAHSASAGFAYNTSDTLPHSHQEAFYTPLSRKFGMVNFSNPAQCRFLYGEKGVVPINAWYWLDKETAGQHDIALPDIWSLADHVYSLTETSTGFLIKLYEYPILNQCSQGVSPQPTQVLSDLLREALNAPRSAGGIPLGDQAHRLAWLKRFSAT